MEEAGYCADPSQVCILPGAREALGALRDAGYLNIVVSNQSGIGRGYFTEAQYHAVQREFLRQIGESLIDACYFCPDAPDSPSAFRKPEPGMVLQAARDFDIDLARSFLIGDKASDIECARRAGARAILVTTGYGASQVCAPDHRAAGPLEAAAFILHSTASSRNPRLPVER